MAWGDAAEQRLDAASLWNQPVIPVFYFDAGIIMLQDCALVVAFFGHGVCAILAHSYAVPIAQGSNAHIPIHKFNGKIGTWQIKSTA